MGDDEDNDDDEDGITFTSPLTPGVSADVNVLVDCTANEGGYLNAWVDFNADGDWNDSGEQIFTNLWLDVLDDPDTPTPYDLSFDVPIDAIPGTTYARFRISSEEGLSPTGEAYNGEVEDYMIEIEEEEPPPSPEPPAVGAVGGEAYPINKVGLIVPWIVLAVVIAAGGFYLIRRRASN